jgi:lipopolysaccharide transport system ATP-binding protein
MRNAIVVENVGKWFSRFHAQKPVTIMEAVLSGLRRMKPVEQFWALRHISFQVAPGEMLGIIGHNGAGKSTLLQLLGGVAYPTEGRIKIQGQVGALLDLGAGMHGDLTGRENVFVMAIAAGLTRREVARRLDPIVAFAELEDFIDNPVRTYSTGMMMRLAFSVAVHTDPEILLVDEFLSVGDLSFQAKCLNRIANIKEQGCAIVLVSHDAGQVKRLCDRALWLRRGAVVAYGEPEVVTGQYVSEMRSQTQQRTPHRPAQLTEAGYPLKVNENRFGSLEVEITNVQINPSANIESGVPLKIKISYITPNYVQSPIFSVSLSRQDNGEIIFDTNTQLTNISIQHIQGEGEIELYLDRLDICHSEYFVDVGIYEQDWAYAYDYHWHVYPLLIKGGSCVNGTLNPPHRWNIQSHQSRESLNFEIPKN